MLAAGQHDIRESRGTADRARVEAVLERARRERARRGLLAFTEYTFPGNYQTNWHHRTICDALDRVVRGDSTRLMIFTPPRHGKSELVSVRLPAFALGVDPNTQIIAASYGADLAHAMSRATQRVIDSDAYQRVFPSTRLNDRNIRSLAGAPLRNVDEFEIPFARGRYKCAGVGGPLTGRGFELGIIDDPIKDRRDADSETYRERVWEWYTNVFFTRRNELYRPARIVIILTRWHEDDLAGRLLRAAEKGEGDQWETIYLPAISGADIDPLDQRTGPNQPLWPDLYDLDAYARIRQQVGPRVWSALYQQRPTPDGGDIFHRRHFRYWSWAPELSATSIRVGDSAPVEYWQLSRFATVDLAISQGEENDFTVIGMWGIHRDGDRANLVLLDLVRERLEGPAILATIKQKWQQWRPGWVGIESVQAQRYMVHFAREAGIAVRELEPDRDKRARAIAATPKFEAGEVFFPAAAPWLADYERELLTFPYGEHDDQVDMTSYGVHAAHWISPAPVAPRTQKRTRELPGLGLGKPEGWR